MRVWFLSWEDSPGEGHGNPLQCFCLENPMDRGHWRATVHEVEKNRTWLKRLSRQAHENLRCGFYLGPRDLFLYRNQQYCFQLFWWINFLFKWLPACEYYWFDFFFFYLHRPIVPTNCYKGVSLLVLCKEKQCEIFPHLLYWRSESSP